MEDKRRNKRFKLHSSGSTIIKSGFLFFSLHFIYFLAISFLSFLMRQLDDIEIDHSYDHDLREHRKGEEDRCRIEDVCGTTFTKFILRIDSQVFGVFTSFPFAFTAATIASMLAILLALQITLKTLIVAGSSFFAANLTAYFVGSNVGSIFEDWHRQKVLDDNDRPSSSNSSSSSSSSAKDKEGLLSKEGNQNYENGYQIPNEDIYVDLPTRSIIRRKSSRPIQRNCYFQVCFIIFIIIGNIFGMMIGSYCAAVFPTHLRDSS